MQHQNGADGGGDTGLAKGQALRCAGKDHALSRLSDRYAGTLYEPFGSGEGNQRDDGNNF